MNTRARGIGGIADLHGEKRKIVAKFGAADLRFRGDVGSLAAKNGPAGGISRGRWFAGFIQEHEAFHQRNSGGRCHARKRLFVASREKTNKLGLILGTSRGQRAFQRGAGSTATCSFGWCARGVSIWLGAGFLCENIRDCEQNGAAQEENLSGDIRFPQLHSNPLPRSISPPD